MLALIEHELDKAGLPYVTLTGDTTDRETPIRRFQEGEVPIFLISLKAGGVGLNLTAADTVIHYDPWWNPAVENQATDRAHRLGQDKPVFVYKLIVGGSIEEKILALQERKAELAAGILSEDRGSTSSSAPTTWPRCSSPSMLQIDSQGDDRVRDGAIALVIGQIADKGTVDFQSIQRECLEVGERRIAGAEIIQGRLDAETMQAAHDVDGANRVAHQQALGNFQLQQTAGQRRFRRVPAARRRAGRCGGTGAPRD
jgi:hypothetical protein